MTKPTFLIIKILKILISVIPVLCSNNIQTGIQQISGSLEAYGTDLPETEYARQVADDESKIVHGLGMLGIPSQLLAPQDVAKVEESLFKYGVNIPLSDYISYNRSLTDVRNPECRTLVYDAELPSVSVVIIFHNEPYSLVLRTVWSVVNSARRWHFTMFGMNASVAYFDEYGKEMKLGYKGQDANDPYVYLKEIVLVDDASTLPELKGKLQYYKNTRWPNLVKILRLPDRLGLIKARLAGARYSTGDVLIFLDAHCEVQRDWLRPLLQRIKDDATILLQPIIDVIDAATFHYVTPYSSVEFQIGSFNFVNGFVDYIQIPPWEQRRRRGDDISPARTPTIAGGIFAVDREFFWSMGGYDEQMQGWGGENLEISFRIWQCGGSMEVVPCSRVGHVHRGFHPYCYGNDSHAINTARLAEVWMDEYAEIFYLHRPELREYPGIGDLRDRKKLREDLQCKSFDWYIKNVLSEKYVPVRDSIAYGRFRNLATGLCLDTRHSAATSLSYLAVRPCSHTLELQQQYSVSVSGQLRDESECVTLYRVQGVDEIIKMPCDKRVEHLQRWRLLDSGQIRHTHSGLCLSGHPSSDRPSLKPCVADDGTQLWSQDIRVMPDGDVYFNSKIFTQSQIEKIKNLMDLRYYTLYNMGKPQEVAGCFILFSLMYPYRRRLQVRYADQMDTTQTTEEYPTNPFNP